MIPHQTVGAPKANAGPPSLTIAIGLGAPKHAQLTQGHRAIQAGRPQESQVDALGRATQRADEPRQNQDLQPHPYQHQNKGPIAPEEAGRLGAILGGVPRTRGPEAMLPHLLEAAHQLGVPPQRATGDPIMRRIQAMGNSPQAMAPALHTSDPRQQAMLLLRGA